MSTFEADYIPAFPTPRPEGVGRIVFPGDPDWDLARATFNVLDDLLPEAVAFPADEREVAAAVSYARRRGLRVAIQATGHNVAPHGPLTGHLLINTSQLQEVSIDVEARRVRVGGGVKWESVTARLSELGLAALHGSSPDVGIAGYSTGGGIGWLARKYGMQANSVTAFELVTAEGHLVRTDATHEPDLFWALRGGNGNYGVVTAVEFTVYPVRELYAGAMFFPVQRMAEVLRVWSELLPTLPEEITSWAVTLHFPPMPEVPEPFRGQSYVILMAAHLGSESEGQELLAPLRALGPQLDTFGMAPPVALAELAMDPADPLPYRSRTALIDELPEKVIEELARIAGQGSPLTMLQLRHGGGALARKAPGAGARATLPGQIVAFALGVVPDPALEPAVRAALDAVAETLAPFHVGDYPNFVEERAETSAFFDEETWLWLRRVKATYDPDDLFHGNHHIPPAPRFGEPGSRPYGRRPEER
jgi:FAD/FMN-containing dehydrogenase